LARSYPVSTAALVTSNLVPLYGVLFLGWDVPTILFAYWIENGIVLVLNVPKTLLVARASGDESGRLGGVLGLALFFTAVYGVFWLVQGAFVTLLTSGGVYETLDPIRYVLNDRQILFAGGLLLGSHLVSFVVNFIGRGEYRQRSVGLQLLAPFPRTMVLQFVAVLGGFVIVAVGEPVALVALLVLFKTVVDLVLHLASHARLAVQTQKPPANGTQTTRAG